MKSPMDRIIKLNKYVKRVEHAKYLGVFIDSHMRWEEHIKKISFKQRKLEAS